MRKEAMLYKTMPDGRVHCYLCSHHCRIGESKVGVCSVRQNIDGRLYTLVYGQSIAANVDPIEKKPLYHFLPGSTSYSIATVGCNFQCEFCQNWQISQAAKDRGIIDEGQELPPEEVIQKARQHGCLSISYTYTEPTIFFEYAYDTARLAKAAGLRNLFVTNGFMTKEALDTIRPYLDAANVDLKSFREHYYRSICKARLQPVLESMAYMKEIGIWLEVTTLIVPGENDSEEELNDIAGFIAGLDSSIPWHISRFRPEHRFLDRKATPMETLQRARDIASAHGLHHAYLGNVGGPANTYCCSCGRLLIARDHRGVAEIHLDDGKCPSCGSRLAGVWE